MSRAERIEAVGYDPAAVALEPVETCNLCGSRHLIEVARRDRYGYPSALAVCARCGLGLLSPRPTAGAYAAFYRDVYRPLVSAYHGRHIDADTVQEEQRGYAAQLHDFLDNVLSAEPASVLDVGGSTGVVAAAFARDGVRPTVLDPAPDELAVAQAAGMEVVEGFAEDFEPGERRWELILLCQTIDHLLDVNATLHAIRGLLAPGGYAFVDVLDVSWVLARQGAIEGAYKVDHPYYLTRTTALGFFARAGLEVVGERMADDGHWGFVLAAAQEREPDWEALERGAHAFLADVWRRRAEAR
ncbi:MAG: class I SAM-dependent methyltransferase [Solirubrobacteraceae bacterium]